MSLVDCQGNIDLVPKQIITFLKSSRNKKDLNDITAALFSVFFLLLAAEKNTPKTGQL